MTITDKLRRFAEIHNMSAIARKAGCGPAVINGYVRAGKIPSAPRAYAIACALGVSVEWLLDDRQDWPPVYVTRDASSPNGAAA
jgi:transcriptional regulator with XRE-family HTH domain